MWNFWTSNFRQQFVVAMRPMFQHKVEHAGVDWRVTGGPILGPRLVISASAGAAELGCGIRQPTSTGQSLDEAERAPYVRPALYIVPKRPA